MEFDFIERAIDFIERTPKIDVLTQWNVYKFLETFLRQMGKKETHILIEFIIYLSSWAELCFD
jgi:hypothetical protein